jgi:hypothetical protein
MRVGDYGTVIRVTITEDDVAVNISAATEKVIRLAKPDGTVTEYTASFTTDGTDGLIQSTVASGVLDQAGIWKVQGRVKTASAQWYSSTSEVEVEDNL